MQTSLISSKSQIQLVKEAEVPLMLAIDNLLAAMLQMSAINLEQEVPQELALDQEQEDLQEPALEEPAKDQEDQEQELIQESMPLDLEQELHLLQATLLDPA